MGQRVAQGGWRAYPFYWRRLHIKSSARKRKEMGAYLAGSRGSLPVAKVSKRGRSRWPRANKPSETHVARGRGGGVVGGRSVGVGLLLGLLLGLVLLRLVWRLVLGFWRHFGVHDAGPPWEEMLVRGRFAKERAGNGGARAVVSR